MPLFTDCAGEFVFPQRTPIIPRYEISKDAEIFISKQSKFVKFRKDLFNIADRSNEFLLKEGIKPKISISLFTDPEYSKWVETKIKIEVPQDDFARTYSLYNELLSYSLKGIRKRTLEKIIVGIDTL